MESNDKLMLALTIGELILKNGIPAALNIIKAWDVENPTSEDIQKLKEKVKDPESYFTE